ncbi:MAG: hypothetical protein P1U68_18395 [Verrucomicrobiales bacterium]|nr:hypothetical protein [Verrucomicrobiales bacterium]
MRHSIAGGINALLLFGLIFPGAGQEEIPEDPTPELEESVVDGNADAESSPVEVVETEEPVEKSIEEIREEMLERVADQLSKRMRSLKERENALEVREKALGEREDSLGDRERMLGSMEELMQLREEVIMRREKLPPPQAWNGAAPPTLYGRYAAVLDGKTMQFYHKKNAETRTPVASTQKLVTALVVCHEGDLDRLVEVPREVYDVEPTVVGVKPGETYTRRQLLTSLLVKSGNDIAATLAIDNAGSIEAFAEKMNIFAKYIGMKDSHFVNPHGLPAEGQYSNARDIAIAAYEAYQVPDIREMVCKVTYEFVFNSGDVRMLYNTNKVLSSFEGCNGMKTGFTYAAGNCLVSSASVDGKDRISVVIKSARPQVWEDSKKLLEWSLGLEMQGPLGTDLALVR